MHEEPQAGGPQRDAIRHALTTVIAILDSLDEHAAAAYVETALDIVQRGIGSESSK